MSKRTIEIELEGLATLCESVPVDQILGDICNEDIQEEYHTRFGTPDSHVEYDLLAAHFHSGKLNLAKLRDAIGTKAFDNAWELAKKGL